MQLRLPLIFLSAWTVLAGPLLMQPAAAQESSSLPAEGTHLAPLPRFAVVSVKETKGLIIRDETRADGSTWIGTNLIHLLRSTYDVVSLDRLIGAPEWAVQKRFDVEAKVNDADIAAFAKLSNAQRGTMLRQVLTERFHLAIHEEERVLPTYLITAKNKPGPNLNRSADPAGLLRYVRASRRGELNLERFTMAEFAARLSEAVHKPVVDQTGLDGLYDMHLTWDPDDAHPIDDAQTTSNNSMDSSKTRPSLSTALEEQLGIKLQPSKGPIKVWVIDHLELPSEN